MHESDQWYEVLEHAADIGFRAHAPALPELFASAAEGRQYRAARNLPAC
jgi:hypothetical protein